MSLRLSKIIAHTKRFGFIKEITATQGNPTAELNAAKDENPRPGKGYDYGPFGALLRRNLVEQWWKHSVTLQDDVFSLSVMDGKEVDPRSKKFLPRENALQNFKTFSEIVSQKEIGIAQITNLPRDDALDSFITGSPITECLTLHKVCSLKKGLGMFNDLVKQRLRWWKKFANKQASFEHHVRETETLDSFQTTAEIHHESSFGTEVIEQISLGIINNRKDDNADDKLLQPNMNFIECCTSVEQAMLTYLDDGLEERIFDEDDDEVFQNVLRLHLSLSPIKLILLAEDSKDEGQMDLLNRLSKEVKLTGIACHTLDLHEENSIYDFADAIGTPFCLKIDERTLQRGIVGLRHRDTTVHEYMHISEVRETLSKFIKF
eukprot:Seg7670.1 transcript_id=Seg7670.1/GoldUCD/mRNA.D3Y31 product="DNA polymerase subunit gamma-2 mitochondrial" protein_id=Seg7670.1/GoldUCD/D3Y31